MTAGESSPSTRATSSTGRRPAVYYGWVMLVAASLGQVTSWGVLYYSFAVFIASPPFLSGAGWTGTGRAP